MKRYIFLLIAFFLNFAARADGMGISNSMGSMNAHPSGLSRNLAQQPSKNLNNNSVSNLATKGKTVKPPANCKKDYSDCIRTNKADHRKVTPVLE